MTATIIDFVKRIEFIGLAAVLLLIITATFYLMDVRKGDR